jgi:HEPN domain-containing protein
MVDMKDVELRDWFAGQALQGILASSQYPPQGSGEPLDQFAARVAERAYRLAEAMLKQGQRLKKETAAAW